MSLITWNRENKDVKRYHEEVITHPQSLYKRRAPTLASHSDSELPGDTSLRSKPITVLPDFTTFLIRYKASLKFKPPGTGVPVLGQKRGSKPSISNDI